MQDYVEELLELTWSLEGEAAEQVISEYDELYGDSYLDECLDV